MLAAAPRPEFRNASPPPDPGRRSAPTLPSPNRSGLDAADAALKAAEQLQAEALETLAEEWAALEVRERRLRIDSDDEVRRLRGARSAAERALPRGGRADQPLTMRRLSTRNTTCEPSRVGRVTRRVWACMPHRRRKGTRAEHLLCIPTPRRPQLGRACHAQVARDRAVLWARLRSRPT